MARTDLIRSDDLHGRWAAHMWRQPPLAKPKGPFSRESVKPFLRKENPIVRSPPEKRFTRFTQFDKVQAQLLRFSLELTPGNPPNSADTTAATGAKQLAQRFISGVVYET